MLAGYLLDMGPSALAAIGLAAFLGHLFPIFFGFRGGKGVATALGVQLGLWWPIGLTVAALWLFVAKVLKFSSLSALISMALAPLVVWIFWPEPVLVGMQLVVTGILFWRHRSNIRNLIEGSEGKIDAGRH
jgi:glycerol-3-phosphate acyltransferase PlsY